MSLELAPSCIEDFDTKEEVMGSEDTKCLQAVLDKEQSAQAAVVKAQEEYFKAAGAKEFVIERITEKYNLGPGDKLTNDGVIVRAE